jgi:DNA polymerase (family 10)
MVNKDIARQFSLLASLMELYGENSFKAKAYASAYLAIRKYEAPLSKMAIEDLNSIPGVGSSVVSKIKELLATGKIDALEKLKERTPEGIQQMLSIKGLGPKKVKVIWEALKIESPAELLYACTENRLIKLPGFGLKTQQDLQQKISYFLDSQDRYLYGNIEEELGLILQKIRITFAGHQVEWVGEFATKSPIISKLSLLIAPEVTSDKLASLPGVIITGESAEDTFEVVYEERLKMTIFSCPESEFTAHWSLHTMYEGLYEKLAEEDAFGQGEDIEEVLTNAGFEGLPAELLDKEEIQNYPITYWEDLVDHGDIKGIIHNHSTYSDGMNTLEEMSVHVRDQGYQYFAICDHSRSAFYANGLPVERVLEQLEEIDRINAKMVPFKVFKGIESDILSDGSLDYEDEILAKFDLVVASIHSNLRMEEAKATSRLIAAIENPYTRILGHPTGRLLLARQGYPINYRKVIDACAANGVSIELNANPLRLDIDYTWMDYCMEKNVLVSINPDAHSRAQVAYVKYGVLAARKGGLKVDSCLNAMTLEEFDNWVLKRQTR